MDCWACGAALVPTTPISDIEDLPIIVCPDCFEELVWQVEECPVCLREFHKNFWEDKQDFYNIY